MSKKTEQSEFYRYCIVCNEQIFYTTKGNLNLAFRKNKPCRKCCKDYNGEKNPFYGKTHTEIVRKNISNRDISYTKTDYFKNNASLFSKRRKDFRGYYKIWIEKYGVEIANKKLLETKKKHSKNNAGSGNPMFGKPPTKGTGDGWSGWYKDLYFRSLLELSYVVSLDKSNIQWISAEKKEV